MHMPLSLWVHWPAAQVSVVHGFMSSQFMLAVGVHTPPVQTAVVTQASPAVQVVPSGSGAFTQLPVAMSHAALWQASGGMQTLGEPGEQVPPLQVSFTVHGLLSLHEAPSSGAPATHVPVD